MFGFFSKYPIMLISFLCLLFLIMANIFFNTTYFNIANTSYLAVMMLCTYYYKSPIEKALLIVASFILAILFTLLNITPKFFFILEVLTIITTLHKAGYNEKNILTSIIAISFLLHLLYIQLTPINIRQHDLSGILGYMHTITIGGLNWNNFTPWNMYYYFHQPLLFLIQGHIFNIFSSTFTSSIIAKESLQYISLFFTTTSIYYIILLIKKLDYKNSELYFMVILFAFNPIFTLFSGFISDDVAVLFWGITCTYYLISWDKSNSNKDIIITAICFGLGSLTKLSILLLVPAISYLFLYKLIKYKNKQIISQISTFIIIAVPLSLIWIIRNHLLFDMQFFNIPETSPQGQSFALLSTINRLTNLSMLFNPFIDAPSISDPNIFLSLIKTELFGEWDFRSLSSIVSIFAYPIYILNLLIKIISFCLCFYYILNTKNNANHIHYFFIILYITIWGYGIHYSITYPYICSSNYRLFSLAMIPEVIILGYTARKKGIGKKLLIPSIVYATLSICVYYTIL